MAATWILLILEQKGKMSCGVWPERPPHFEHPRPRTEYSGCCLFGYVYVHGFREPSVHQVEPSKLVADRLARDPL